MAVKYSTTKDFGVKGRKTLKLGNKMFTKKSTHRLKSIAKKKAISWRKKGYIVRVVKLTKSYGVYTHTK